MKIECIGEGDVLIAGDSPSGCLTPGARYRVMRYSSSNSYMQEAHGGRLYIRCMHGEHFLDGQADRDGEVEGFRLAPRLTIVRNDGG
jgi:hypothetical protein